MLANYLSFCAALLGIALGFHYWLTHKQSSRKILRLSVFLFLGSLGYAIALISALFFSLVNTTLSELVIGYAALALLLFFLLQTQKLQRPTLYFTAFFQVLASLILIDHFPHQMNTTAWPSLELLTCILMTSVCFYCAALAKNSLGFGFLLIGSAWLIFTGVYLYFLL